jgi:Mrp family chromosome partitioning ATPase
MLEKKQFVMEKRAPLELTTADGQTLCVYQPEVIDSLRNMASRLTYPGRLPSSLGFTSALGQEGVTFLSRAWGLTIANDLQIKVCVVELNWWRPETVLANIRSSPGLAAMKSGTSMSEVMISTNCPNLTLIPAGELNVVERPVWSRSDALISLIADLGQQFDHLVLDIPAIHATTEALPLAALADKISLVVHQGVTPVESLRLALDRIRQMPVAGVVLNRYRTVVPGWMLNLIPQDANSITSS